MTTERATRIAYSEALADTICERLADGESLRAICRSEDMPVKSSVMKWLNEHPDFEEKYDRARRWQADSFVDELIDISDDTASDRNADGSWNTEHIQRQRLRVDTRKWVAGKMHPRRYGEKVTQELTGPGGGPVQFERIERVIIDPKAPE